MMPARRGPLHSQRRNKGRDILNIHQIVRVQVAAPIPGSARCTWTNIGRGPRRAPPAVRSFRRQCV